jgi:hypothetical protein
MPYFAGISLPLKWSFQIVLAKCKIYMFPAISMCLILKIDRINGSLVKFKNLICMGHVYSAQLKTMVTQFYLFPGPTT